MNHEPFVQQHMVSALDPARLWRTVLSAISGDALPRPCQSQECRFSCAAGTTPPPGRRKPRPPHGRNHLRQQIKTGSSVTITDHAQSRPEQRLEDGRKGRGGRQGGARGEGRSRNGKMAKGQISKEYPRGPCPIRVWPFGTLALWPFAIWPFPPPPPFPPPKTPFPRPLQLRAREFFIATEEFPLRAAPARNATDPFSLRAARARNTTAASPLRAAPARNAAETFSLRGLVARTTELRLVPPTAVVSGR